jgi:hypothetical protein
MLLHEAVDARATSQHFVDTARDHESTIVLATQLPGAYLPKGEQKDRHNRNRRGDGHERDYRPLVSDPILLDSLGNPAIPTRLERVSKRGRRLWQSCGHSVLVWPHS